MEMLMLLSSYHVEATSKKLQADLSPRKKVVEYPHSESFEDHIFLGGVSKSSWVNRGRLPSTSTCSAKMAPSILADELEVALELRGLLLLLQRRFWISMRWTEDCSGYWLNGGGVLELDASAVMLVEATVRGVYASTGVLSSPSFESSSDTFVTTMPHRFITDLKAPKHGWKTAAIAENVEF